MASDLHRGDGLVAGSPGLASLTWAPAFDQHVPARVVSAVSFTDGFVVLSGESGIAPAIAAAVVDRMRESGFEVATVTAPLSDPSALYQAIRDALLAKPAPERPLVVVVEHAEGLSMQTVHRLAKMGELRHTGRPVLRVVLTGTPALWPILRDAGLGDLEDDAAAHVRLMPDLIRYLPEPPPAADGYAHAPEPAGFGCAITGLAPRGREVPLSPVDAAAHPGLPSLRPSRGRAGPRAAVLVTGLALAGLAGGAAIWTVLPSRPDRQAIVMPAPPAAAVPPSSPDERLASLLDREDKEIAAGHPLPGGDLAETRRQIDEILPHVSSDALRALAARPGTAAPAVVAIPVPAPPAAARMPSADPSPSVPAGSSPGPDASAPGEAPWAGAPVDAPAPGPVHVTVQYSRGDSAAAARAMRIRTLLHDKGIPVDGPVATGQAIERSSLAYYFTQDQTAALDLARQLSLRAPPVRRLPPPGGLSLPRPGEISISIGSGDIARTIPSGNHT